MTDAALHRGMLGIEGDTDAADIRRRHRALLKRYHPDRAPRGREGEFLERAKDLNAAREWLLASPSSWRVEVPAAPMVQPPLARRESSAMSIPVAASPRSGTSWVMTALGLYLGTLALAILGWILSVLLGG